MTVLQVARSAYGSSVSVHGLIRNLKFPIAFDVLSKPRATQIPGFPDDSLSTVREFRHRRWASRRSSRPVISESITGPLPASEDDADQLDWAWSTSRFVLTGEDWMAANDLPFSEVPHHVERELISA